MTGTFRPGRRLACLAVLAALPLSACAAGYQAETSRERTTLTSVGAAKGNLTLRNIYLLGPGTQGHALSLKLAMFNGGRLDDRLVSISSTGAASGYVPATATIPAGGSLSYVLGGSPSPVLINLKRNVLVGQSLPVTMTFAKTGDITRTIPVMSAANVTGTPNP